MHNNYANKLMILTMLFVLICTFIFPNVCGTIIADTKDLDHTNYTESLNPTLDYKYNNYLCFIKGEATNAYFSSNPDQRICIWNSIAFWNSWPEPSFGSVLTIGLKGIQTFTERSFCGLTFFEGVHGFTGVKQKLSEEPDPHGYTYSFSGFAIRVELTVMGV